MIRWPAEWAAQDAVLLAWPHEGTDWAENLDQVRACYTALISSLQPHVKVLLLVANDQIGREARTALASRITPGRLRLLEVPYHDTWLRDSGPISLFDESQPVWVDFRFTGWGGKFEASLDDRIVGELVDRSVFAESTHRPIDWALEGGAIESDGRGSILTTWKCLHLRHPDQSREQIDAVLCDTLAATRVLWLDHGYLEGDDTDAHIDTLARFAPDDAIVYQACSDPADRHYEELGRMRSELEALRTPEGKPYRLYALPWPKPIIDEGRRLAASYANYLIVNGAVLVPAYGDEADNEAARIIGLAHPGREIVQIPCRPLIWQNGSLHCVTMQLPEGVLA